MGGFGAVYAALAHPETFGNVLSQSGSLLWSPEVKGFREDGWLMQQYISKPVVPTRFYLEAGSLEIDPEGGFGLEAAARRLTDVLRAKGYPVSFNLFYGHHDEVVWRDSIAAGLIWLFSDQVR
jgi:enterochelin esterase family protein